ncbi:MAG TPA: lysophospholipid acyltransferase family protein [Paracoccaceae bacterium]|nr:lysophospholipid acyltransferase family protein [Paracoccaceae bacterium]
MDGAAAREISYAYSVRGRAAQVFVRGLENVTGRPGLIRAARDYEKEVAAGADFWEVMTRRYRLALDLPGPGLANLPAEGPLVVIANHPFGILDGLMLGRILSAVRGRDGFRIMAHQVFRKAGEIDAVILPISFDADREAQRINVATRREAHRFLGAGGAVGVFPGGTVSTARDPFGPALDPAWRTFTAKLIARSGAAVVPVFFEGTNSRTFQLASHLHYALRMGLLINEFRRRVGGTVRAVIGAPLARDEIEARRGDSRALMDYLRLETYRLSPRPLADLGYGYEFDDG